jgi:GNAT superfamily N-acetyltransferase
LSEIIRTAVTAADFVAYAGLIDEYAQWLRDRYQGRTWFVEQVFDHQALDDEIKALPSAYSAPRGKALLAWREGELSGGVAYRRLSDATCEMKRLFVPDRHKGKGTGRRLCAAILACARDDGYRVMRLDTGDLFTEAIAMYRSFGFRECVAYHEYPPELRPYMVFMELSLQAPLS